MSLTEVRIGGHLQIQNSRKLVHRLLAILKPFLNLFIPLEHLPMKSKTKLQREFGDTFFRLMIRSAVL